MADEVIDLSFKWHADELRQSWQGRALVGTKGLLNALITSVLAHNFEEAMPVLLRVVYPGFDGTAPPMYFTSAGRVDKAGQVIADLADSRTGIVNRRVKVFDSEIHMRDVFRRLADLMKLGDADRIQMFVAARKWIVADERLDPTMNPMDPDAKRLTVN